jgi:hypothetical protein
MALENSDVTPQNPDVGDAPPPEGTTAQPAPESPPSDAAPAATADESLLGGDKGAAPAEKPTAIPDNWRELVAGQDAAALNLLKRIPSFDALGKKIVEQDRLISAGKQKPTLSENATEEELAAWREQNGIPKEPAGYLEVMEGLVIGDDDKPLVESFLETAHKNNADPKFVQSALSWYYEAEAQKASAQLQADREYRVEAKQQLQEAMGPDYEPNMQDLRNWLGQSEGVYDVLLSSRLADGTLLGDNPTVVNFLVSQMREINPLITVAPASGSSAHLSIDEQVAEMEQQMRTPEGHEKYWGDKRMQQRYRELLAAQEKMQQKRA